MQMTSLMQFPCLFPIKVMGLNSDAFTAAVLSTFRNHLGTAQFTQCSRLSSGGKYLSITVTFMAQSQEQLNAIYAELKLNELVVMTL